MGGVATSEECGGGATSRALCDLLPPFQITSHSKNPGESNHLKVWQKL